MFAFKKFSFFQQVEAKLHGFPANSTCTCVGGARLWVGADSGAVHVLDDAYASQGAFNAYGHKLLFMAWAPVREHCLLLVCCAVLGLLAGTQRLSAFTAWGRSWPRTQRALAHVMQG
jgi:hypothetical protein